MISFSRALALAAFLTFSTFDVALILVTQCVIVLFLSLLIAGILRRDERLRQEVLAAIARELSPACLEIAAKLCTSGEKIAVIVRSTISAVTGKSLEATSREAVVKQYDGVLTIEIPYRLSGVDHVTHAPFDNTVSRNRKTYAVTGDERKHIPVHPGVISVLTADMLGADEIVIVDDDDDMETF